MHGRTQARGRMCIVMPRMVLAKAGARLQRGDSGRSGRPGRWNARVDWGGRQASAGDNAPSFHLILVKRGWLGHESQLHSRRHQVLRAHQRKSVEQLHEIVLLKRTLLNHSETGNPEKGDGVLREPPEVKYALCSAMRRSSAYIQCAACSIRYG